MTPDPRESPEHIRRQMRYTTVDDLRRHSMPLRTERRISNGRQGSFLNQAIQNKHGIYFLLEDHCVVYIGSSTNIYSRLQRRDLQAMSPNLIALHAYDLPNRLFPAPKSDHGGWRGFHEVIDQAIVDSMKKLELAYIRHFRPMHNKTGVLLNDLDIKKALCVCPNCGHQWVDIDKLDNKNKA